MEALSVSEKIALSDARFEKSKKMLSDAERSLGAGMYMTSANRSYYVILNAARSILILKGIDPISHDGVQTMLSLHFVKEGLLPREVIKIFKSLLILRTDVDYGDFETIEKNEAEDAVKQAKKFLKVMKTERERLIREMS